VANEKGKTASSLTYSEAIAARRREILEKSLARALKSGGRLEPLTDTQALVRARCESLARQGNPLALKKPLLPILDNKVPPTLERAAKTEVLKSSTGDAHQIPGLLGSLIHSGQITDTQFAAAMRYRHDHDIGMGSAAVTARYGEFGSSSGKGAKDFYATEVQHAHLQSFEAARAFLAGKHPPHLFSQIAKQVILEIPLEGKSTPCTWTEIGAWASPHKGPDQRVASAKMAARSVCHMLEVYYDRIAGQVPTRSGSVPLRSGDFDRVQKAAARIFLSLENSLLTRPQG